MALDTIDYHIVDLLQLDARATQLEIAREVGLSQPAVAERIRKLEEKRVISGYTALVDATSLGKDITAFIGVSIEHPKYFDAFARRIQDIAEILECHRVAGEATYLLKVKTDNTHTLDLLLTKTLRKIPGVTRTVTTIALSSIKEGTRVPVSLARGADR
jgi:Lrp/AsnC family transcriptional regulator, leucine-responsive regulatory protein